MFTHILLKTQNLQLLNYNCEKFYFEYFQTTISYYNFNFDFMKPLTINKNVDTLIFIKDEHVKGIIHCSTGFNSSKLRNY